MSYYVTHENSVLNINNAHLKVSGNVHTDVMKLGAIEFAPPASDVPGTVNFTNVTTGVTTTSNLNVGGTLMLGSVELAMATNALEQTVNLGNTTSNTVQFTNPTTGLVATGNVETQGKFIGDGSALTGITSGQWSESSGNIYRSSGRVGIGTVSPDEKLHVNGNIRLGGPQGTDEDASYYIKSAGQIHINSAADGTADDSYICLDLTAGQANNNRSRIGICGAATNASYQHISFDTKDTERMRITNDGDLGIGTAAPGEKLEVHGHIKAGGNSYQNGYVVMENGGSLYRNYGGTSGGGLHMTGGAVIPADHTGGNHTSAYTQLGTSLYRWGQIYSTSSTISTSDRNEKQDINEITESERKVASKIVDLFRTFRMKDAVSKKGDEARLHNGVIAQDLIEVFQSEGLNAHRYGLFCYDDIWLVDGENELYETVYEKDDSEDGGLKEVKVKTGIFADKDTPGAVATPGPYSIRYEELLCFVVAGELQNERIKYSALEARITALENL